MSIAFDELRKLAPRVTPTALALYLTRRGWTAATWPRESTAAYAPPPALDLPHDYLLVVPRRAELSDYADLVSRVVWVLADVEQRNPLDVLAQMTRFCDVLRASAVSSTAVDGTIPIADASRLIDEFRDILTFSACAELAGTRAFFPRKLKHAQELAENCRFGQTEIGSFVMSFYVPLPIPGSVATQTSLFFKSAAEPAAPLERRALERVFVGAADVLAAARAGNANHLVERVDTGFNANMCEILSSMLHTVGSGHVALAAALDPLWPTSRPRPSVEIPVSDAVQSVLTMAVEALRVLPALGRTTIHGYVYLLKNERQPGSDTDRTVRITWEHGRDIYKVVTRLSASDYRRACSAHEADLPVRVSGDLRKQGRGWVLHEPRDFTVLSVETLPFGG